MSSAHGWRAVFVECETGSLFARPLAGWAIIDWSGDEEAGPMQEVVGMATFVGDVSLCVCDSAENFLGYLEPQGDMTEYVQVAQDHMVDCERTKKRTAN